MDDKALDRLFTGDLDQLVPLPKRVVRLFISSTFTDMMLERNSLMERVYSKLKKYCRERHGLDFQVVDMRWGVRDEATDDHQTANLCSREIDNCQRMSLGPNFVALIGDKYGFRPLCNKIKSTEYRALRRCLIELDIVTDFLDTWYKEDLNAVPAEYLLQPISSILKNFTNKNEPDLQAVDQRFWQAIQQRLHELLMIGSSRLVEQGRMSKQEQLMKYSISVTEREVIEGCLNVKEAKSNCLVYVRSIVDISEQLSRCQADSMLSPPPPPLPQQQQQSNTFPNIIGVERPKEEAEEKITATTSTITNVATKNRRAALQNGEDTINLRTTKSGGVGGNTGRNERRVERIRNLLAKYIDLSSKGENVWSLDDEAQNLLGHLKAVKLETTRALSKYKVLWDENEGMSLKSEEHRRYLNEFTDHFYMNIAKMIRRARRDDQEFKSDLIGEVLQHSHYAKHVSRSFYGRSNELDQIRSYILGSTMGSVGFDAADAGAHELMPMFVYGVGGSGKTSVLARAATMAKDWIQRARSSSKGGQAQDERWDQRPCIIMRFCCTTPSSSSMVGVLTSVCRQLQYNLYQFGPLSGVMNQKTEYHSAGLGTTREVGGGGGAGELASAEPQLPYEPIPEDFVRLVFTFRQLIDNCRHHYHKGRLFLIILDSVERLSSPAESSVEVKYSWLTGLTKLPANVRFIVSCSSERVASETRDGSMDFVHLKRHFLRLYLPLDNKDVLLANVSPQSDRPPHPDLSMDAAALDLTMRSGPAPERSKESLAGNLLKRLVLPAMRLTRATQKLLSPDPQPTVRDEDGGDIGRHSLKRSSSSLSIGLPNETKSNYSVRTGKEHKLVGDLGRSPSSLGRLSCTSRLSSEPPNSPIDRNSGEYHWPARAPRRASAVNMIHVRPMGVDLALNVVRLWLQEMGRTLTPQQWSIARRSFAQCSRPIFVKLTFGEIVNWKSYSVQSDSKGLTFGSSILEGCHEIKATGSAAAVDSKLRLLMDHCEPGSASAQFKRQILTMEREWLGYLGYSQRKAEPGKVGPTAEGDLFIKLGGDSQSQMAALGGVARSWNGGVALASNICHLSSTIDEAISQLFARIELQHGYLLTKHSLSYITAARNGICENELEDILSLDDVVLDDVFQYHFPPVRRIPPLLWTRIRNDLADYLSERDADGIVVNWHHNQFKLVAQRRYLNERRQLLYIHSNVADYFMGRWADVPKPFNCSKQQLLMATEQLESSTRQSLRDSEAPSSPTTGTSSLTGGRFGGSGTTSGSASGGRSFAGGRSGRLRSSGQSDRSTNWRQAKADRRVPFQPLYHVALSTATGEAGEQMFRDSKLAGKLKQDSQRRRYNLRKLTELPYHLMRSCRFVDLANEVLFNYKWLYASIDATGLQSLLSDFDEASRSLEAALSDRMAAVAKIQEQKSESTYLSAGRKKDDLDEDTLRSMISQLNIINNTIRLSSSSIHLDTQMLAPQLIGRLLPLTRCNGGRQPTLAGQQNEIGYLIKLLEQCDRDGCLDCALLPTDHCLQVPNGLQLSSLEGHSFAILSMCMAADQRHLLAVSNRFIMWDITTGEVSRDVDPNCEGSLMMELRMGLNDEYAIAYTSNNIILALDILTQQVVKFNVLGQLNHQTKSCDEKIIGMELVDSFGASKFVVWTKKRWFIMRIDKNELIRSASMPQRISIELEHSIELAVELGGYNLDPSLNIQQVFHDENTNVTFLLVYNSECRISLLTVSRSNENPHCLMLWKQQIEAASLCLDPSLRQLVFSNYQGVFLTRRRSAHWSKPKLIWSRGSSKLSLNAEASMASLNSTELLKIYLAPLAIELNSGRGYGSAQQRANIFDSDSSELAAFERRIDGTQVDDELGASALLSKQTDQIEQVRSASLHKSRGAGYPRTVLLYLNDRIVVLRLNTKQERNLILPRDIRNMSVEPNKCQIRAIILGAHLNTEGFLAAAVGRRLLLYSIGEEQFLRSIDAHASRIVQLMPIVSQMSKESLDLEDDRWLSFASASLDKTVKIWNLTNLEKDIHTLEKLDNPIESMSLARQRPWVACLGRSELGLWDWRTMRLLARLSQHDLAAKSSRAHNSDVNQNQQDKGRQTVGSRLLKCRLSSDGRHLCLATLKSIHLFVVEKIPAPESRYQLKSCLEHQLPEEALVRQFRFFQQDSKLLTSVECPMFGSARRPSEETSISSGVGSSLTARRLLVLCHSIPDGRLLYTIVSITPTIQQNPTDSHRGLDAYRGSNRIRLPVLTRDQLHVVTVESESASDETNARPFVGPTIRKRSSGTRLSTLLGVYSARDGLLLRYINLDQLEPYNQRPEQPQQQQQPELEPSGILTGNQQQPQYGQSVSESFSNLSVEQRSRNSGQLCSVAGDQFSRLKSVASYRERQSIVALLDDERSSSFMVDVNTRQLMANSSIWNGKLSANGRFGLSRMFKSAGSLRATAAPSAATTANQTSTPATTTTTTTTTAGLQLVEMGHCAPIKTLLSHETISKLSTPRLEIRGPTGNDTDITCGFAGPNDSHVYYHDSRLAKLLLIRVRDGQLVANYKLSTRVTKIKCSGDGYALVLGLADGSLTSLAIVDPLKDDTVVRLAEYPSRKRDVT